MALLPTQQYEQRRRKGQRKPSSYPNKSLILLICGVFFLGIVGYRRTTRSSASVASQGFNAGSRRDLKEKYAAGDAALFNDGEWAKGAPAQGITTFPATSAARRLLIATHSRLAWYYYETEQFTVIHEGQGVYYGVFPGDSFDSEGVPSTVWVVSRPHNWRPTTSQEWLIELDTASGEELRRVSLDSRFTHDTVRAGDRVYAANTGGGEILELEFPSMSLLRRLQLFTLKEHVNTLSPTVDGKMWAMLHNLGNSALALIDIQSGKEVRRLTDVGLKAHGAVQWRNSLIVLDSDHATLIRVDPETGAKKQLWTAPDTKRYFKGLSVVDDIAFFGIAEAQERQSRDSTDLNCEVAAFDLIEGVLLWRRQLQTRGLLNVIAAPHLQVESTAHAVWVKNAEESYRATHAYQEVLTAAKAAASKPRFQDPFLDEEGNVSGDGKNNMKFTLLDLEPLPMSDPLIKYPPKIGSRWASGFPRLDNSAKDKKHGLTSGAQLPLFRWNHTALRDYLLSLPAEDWTDEGAKKGNAFLTGRNQNLNQFKPGTGSIHVFFSDNAGKDVYEFPWYKERFAKYIDPLLDKLLGADVSNIIRLQFAIMPGQTHIKRHVDKGGYSAAGHRIHLVVASSPKVTFNVCEEEICVPIHVDEGLVFELNNRLEHFVDNDGDEPRIHMVVDVVETPRKRTPLKVGQICTYAGKIRC